MTFVWLKSDFTFWLYPITETFCCGSICSQSLLILRTRAFWLQSTYLAHLSFVVRVELMLSALYNKIGSFQSFNEWIATFSCDSQYQTFPKTGLISDRDANTLTRLRQSTKVTRQGSAYYSWISSQTDLFLSSAEFPLWSPYWPHFSLSSTFSVLWSWNYFGHLNLFWPN